MRTRLGVRAFWVVVGGVAVGLAAGGIAYASVPDSSGLIHGCYNPNGVTAVNGTALNIIDRDKASCSKNQQEISWSQTGPPGPKGDKGDQGPSGTFAGAFQSPNGDYGISVTDNGIQLSGPNGSIQIGSGGVSLNAGGSHVSIDQLGGVDVQGSHDITVQGSANVDMHAGAQAIIEGAAVTDVNGGVVQLNGCSRQVSGVGDQILGTDSGGAVTGGILTGSQSVCAG
jgi:hypothetical protein